MSTTAYPPDEHVLRDLRYEVERLDAHHVRGYAPRQRGVCADDGSMRVSAIAMTIDVAGAAVALVAASPDWAATADLACWNAGPVHGDLACDARLVRAGSGVIVVEADWYDTLGAAATSSRAVPGNDPLAGARLAGHARLSFARIPARASVAAGSMDRSGAPTERTGIHRPQCNLDDPLFAKAGIQVLDAAAGVVECPKSDYVRNSFGTINGGVMGVIAEAAAEPAARYETGKPLVARDLQVHYLAQTKAGPARTSCRVLRADEHHAVVEVRVVDISTGTLLALATVGLG